MELLALKGFHGRTFTEEHFGANILSTRDRLGNDGTFDDAADYLGAGPIRYPGGSLTERYFDITDPDRIETEHYKSGAPMEMLPYSDFMDWAEETGRAVLIVLPTRTQLSEETDANGDRYAEVDEDALRTFIRDTLDGTYGQPEIAGFEIGNEYWGSGEMTSVEYGRVASTMARIVDAELTAHPEYDALFSETDILVQMGLNYNFASLSDRYEGTAEEQIAQFSAEYDLPLEDGYIYSSGEIAWPKLANLLIMREFDEPAEIDALDGIVAHVYSRGEDLTSSQTFELRTIEDTWGQEYEDLKPVVTEWNVKAPSRDSTEDFGLVQAGQMLDMVEAMGLYEATSAYIWAVQQGSQSNLTGDEGQPDMKVGGEFFKMMAEALPGTRAIELDGADPRESEIAFENSEVHLFAGAERAVFYIQSTNSTETHSTDIDFSNLITGFDNITMTKLGVAPGDLVGSSKATPVVTELDPNDHYDNGTISVSLNAREIVQITIEGADFTPELEAGLAQSEATEFGFMPETADSEFFTMMTQQPAPQSDPLTIEQIAAQTEAASAQAEANTEEDDSPEGGGMMGDMGILAMLLPLIALAGAL
ncbi:type I secretion protein [Seohaeicola saemankumensis]|uniref:type I secretion protein n=1 Tax=Seohaeicola saemankumensis TaxID=481181 RepID=UPI001E5A5EDC|nr:type I secretion protein [Seohaeicola saemankumensis]MCD1627346.1 type I secretion protein [Seohaeicola saemankumensis]